MYWGFRVNLHINAITNLLEVQENSRIYFLYCAQNIVCSNSEVKLKCMIFCANRLYLTKNGFTAYPKKKKKKRASPNCLASHFEFLTPPIVKKPKTKTMGIIIIINEKLCSYFNTARSILIKTFTTIEKRSGLG